MDEIKKICKDLLEEKKNLNYSRMPPNQKLPNIKNDTEKGLYSF